MHEISTLTRVGRLAIVLADNHVRHDSPGAGRTGGDRWSRPYSPTAPYHVQRSTSACRQGTDDDSSWRVDGCSTGFQRPSMDSQRSWATLSS